MIKLARLFFHYQRVTVNTLDDFFNSDLCLYFEKLYKTKLKISNTGFIKIIRRDSKFELYENVFYDWACEYSDEYITFEGIDMRLGFIQNTEAGKQLSQKGYYVFENNPDIIARAIHPVEKLKFNSDGCDRLTEPNAMFKYSPKVWGDVQLFKPQHVDYEAYSLFKMMEIRMTHLLSFSNVLLSLDAYDMICLKWSEGRSILPHNDLDIRMFVNLISYNDKSVYTPRYLKVGEYDWYDYIFHAILTDQWESTNHITSKRIEYEKIASVNFRSPIVNVFNPRFYHEVTPLIDGELYSISAHKSFKALVDKMELSR